MAKVFGWLLWLVPMTVLGANTAARSEFVTQDFFVEHVSSVPANAGQKVGLFVRQKILTQLA